MPPADPWTGAALIGADGLWSAVRKSASRRLRYAGLRRRHRDAHGDPRGRGRAARHACRGPVARARPRMSCTIPCAAAREIAVVVIARERLAWPRLGCTSRRGRAAGAPRVRSMRASPDVLARGSALAPVGAAHAAAAAHVGARSCRADGRCRPSHAALPGAGRCARAGGRDRPGAMPDRDARAMSPLRCRATSACAARAPHVSQARACARAASIVCRRRSRGRAMPFCVLAPGALLMARFDWLYGWRPPPARRATYPRGDSVARLPVRR